jgi:type I restriction enzyme S subunit
MNKVMNIHLDRLLRLERRPVRVVADSQYAEIGIYSFGRGIFHKAPRNGLEVGNKELFLIKEKDFILQVTFAWEGAIALASASEDGMYGSTRFPTFRVDESLCYPPYLTYYFKTVSGREQLVRISPGSAGRNRVLSLKRMSEVIVPLPSLIEQQRIVARIEELSTQVQKALALRQQAVEETEGLVDSTMNHILSRPASQTWEYGTIPEFANINPSRVGQISLTDSDLVSFVPMRAVDDINGTIARPEIRTLAEVSKGYTWFKDGDVIFARITPCMQNGKSAIARGLKNGIAFGSTEFHVIRPRSKLTAEWLHAIVRHKAFRDDASAHFKGTAGQQRVPQSFLEKKVIPVPSLSEQHSIMAELESLNTKVNELKHMQAETSVELDALLPSLLDQAFKGEL